MHPGASGCILPLSTFHARTHARARAPIGLTIETPPTRPPTCPQAGARKVYAVEASGMARLARQLAAANPAIASRVEVLNAKVEELVLPEKVWTVWTGWGSTVESHCLRV
jgi:hypothetical protein